MSRKRDGKIPIIDAVPYEVISPEGEELWPKKHIERVRQAERGTYVKETLTTSGIDTIDPFADELAKPREELVPVQGELMPYTRVADLAPGLRLVPLEEFAGRDLILFRYDKWNGDLGEFLTLEVALLDNPEDRFLANCGGQDAMEKVINAFQMVAEKKANPPLVAAFDKIPTRSGRTFWVVR